MSSPSPPLMSPGDNSFANAAAAGHKCSQCGKVYARRTHLRRHESSHSASGLIHCPFCNKTFARTDGLRRHTRICSNRGHHDIPSHSKRGRKPEACDRCSSSKLSCDKQTPCQRCSFRGLPCSYSRCAGRAGYSPPSLNPSSSTAHHFPRQSDNNPKGFGAPLLLSLTESTARSMAQTLALEGIGLHARFHDAPEPYPDVPGLFSQRSPSLSTFSASETGDIPRRPSYQASLDTGTHIPPSTSPPSQDLPARLHALILELSRLPTPLHDLYTFNASLAYSTFTPANLTEFTSSYFLALHPHFPILHRPTYHPERASLSLLLAVFLAGAAASAPRDHALSARQFFGVGERYVYRCLDNLHLSGRLEKKKKKTNYYDDDGGNGDGDVDGSGGDEGDGDGGVRMGDEDIELLQAALLMNAIQSQVRDIAIRRRVRTQRHPVLVAALRCAELLGARHGDASRRDWRAFVGSETRVRLASLTFLWDCYATISSSSPPQMAIAEMRGDMPCTECLYEAEAASEFAYLQPAEHNNCRRSLRDLVATLFEDEWRESQKVLLMSAITQPRLLLLICEAVHSVLSQNRACVLGQTILASIWRATERWKELFDREYETSSRLARYRHLDIPFKDRSLEFWWLAQKIVREICARGDTCEYLQNIGDDSYQPFRAFLLAELETGEAGMQQTCLSA